MAIGELLNQMARMLESGAQDRAQLHTDIAGMRADIMHLRRADLDCAEKMRTVINKTYEGQHSKLPWASLSAEILRSREGK